MPSLLEGLSPEKLRLRAQRVLTSFWFTPLLMGIAGFLVALLVVSFDRDLADTGVLFLSWEIDPAVARALLGTIAAATISAASVVYSLSLLIRNLAATTLGPRLVQNFRKNSMTRVALGAQLAVFIYALTALFQVGVVDELSTVSIIIAIVGIVAALGMLVFFVNAIADQVSVDQIVGRIATELRQIVDRRLDQIAEGDDASAAPIDGATVTGESSGYVQALDYAWLAATEALKGRRVQLLVRPGDYVVPRQPLAQLDTPQITEPATEAIRQAILLGHDRTQEQDPIAHFDLLVEVALRALSPSLNDVFTAVSCVHHLSAAFARFDGSPLTAPAHRGACAEVRPRPMPFAEIANKVFNPLRHAGTAIPLMVNTMLDSLEMLIATSREDAARSVYHHHARLTYDQALEQLHLAADRDALTTRFRQIEAAFARSPSQAEAVLVEHKRGGRPRSQRGA